MKKLILLTGLLLLFAAGCGEKEPVQQDADLTLNNGQKTDIVLDSQGGMKYIRFTSAKAWHVEVGDDASWLEITPMEGESGDGRVKIQSDTNSSGEKRSCELRICSDDKSLNFTVEQDYYEPIFRIPEIDWIPLSPEGALVAVPIETNQMFAVECEADWITPVPSEETYPEYVMFGIGPNFDPVPRRAEVRFESSAGSLVVSIPQAAAGAESMQWVDKSFVHRSLAMRFTATWCGYCPNMGKAFDSAKSQMGGSLELVSLHGPESALEFPGTNSLINRFNVSGFPTGIVDGRASIPNNSSTSMITSAVVDVANETHTSYPVTSAIACESEFDGTYLSFWVAAYFKKAGNYRVFALVLEDNIVESQSGAGVGYIHNDVARAALTPMSGTSVNVAEDNTVWSGAYSAKVTASNPDNLKILVYVEKSYGDQTLVENVEEVEYGYYGGQYVDNCRVVPVGKYVELEVK